MKTNQDQIQQGDCLFRIVEKLPDGCKRRQSRTIALGEATGHHHTWEDGVVIMDGPDGSVFCINETETDKSLIHQEHHVVTLKPGEIADFGQVIEKDWFQDMVRNVRD